MHKIVCFQVNACLPFQLGVLHNIVYLNELFVLIFYASYLRFRHFYTNVVWSFWNRAVWFKPNTRCFYNVYIRMFLAVPWKFKRIKVVYVIGKFSCSMDSHAALAAGIYDVWCPWHWPRTEVPNRSVIYSGWLVATES